MAGSGRRNDALDLDLLGPEIEAVLLGQSRRQRRSGEVSALDEHLAEAATRPLALLGEPFPECGLGQVPVPDEDVAERAPAAHSRLGTDGACCGLLDTRYRSQLDPMLPGERPSERNARDALASDENLTQ